ncbi:Integrase catalytic domain-containing protein [Aphis craccivora]|uniref:Integrase catalytic domain-containing protein n=1 Tax=Aphis craccivora TaxID=307492 RepID=A0A6G0Y8Q1_APHCR|nr:Integrase catalytic domain-containing protein [Aphis craccivora]
MEAPNKKVRLSGGASCSEEDNPPTLPTLGKPTVLKSWVRHRYRPVVQPIMDDLPKVRVEPSRAFSKVGVNFAGPFYIKASLRRNAPTNKAYACIWVCLATKAVHVEVVGDLTTQFFLNTLQRFCDRRGIKGATFIQEQQHQVIDVTTKCGIQWHFIPPRSPHFGGNTSLTFEELNTIFVRIEAILNSRPFLTPLSIDPSDMSVLTPGHFLIGNSLCALPDRDETTTPPNRLSRWRRWSKSQGSSIQVETVVLIRDDNLPPLQWSIGRVIEIHVGADNQVRVATVKTSHGKFQHVVRNLCSLPFDDNQSTRD